MALLKRYPPEGFDKSQSQYTVLKILIDIICNVPKNPREGL